MIHVLMVEDSPSVRLLLHQILESDPDICVVHSVASGEEALLYLARTDRPPVHVVTMDIVMPGMDGFSATRRIMETTPLPIVIVSAAYKPDEAESSFKAMDAGAVAIVEKPVAPTHPDYSTIAAYMTETVKLMAAVKVVTRFPRLLKRSTVPLSPASFSPFFSPLVPGKTGNISRDFEVLAIGASTGGPPVILAILTALTPHFPLPVLIVQHISQGFVTGLAQWLENSSGMPVHVASAGEMCRPGHVYLAPDNCHMGLTYGLRILLNQSNPEKGQRPSVSFLFRSLTQVCGKRVIGVLLTGMGSDGATELKEMREAGAVTFAQNEESCIVYGMPGEAVKLDGADYVLPPMGIVEKIRAIVN